MVGFAGANGFTCIGFGRTGQDRHTAGRLVRHDFDDSLSFLGSETYKLTGGAIRVKSVNTAFDEPINVLTQFGFVDFSPVIERNDVGCKNPCQAIRGRHGK